MLDIAPPRSSFLPAMESPETHRIRLTLHYDGTTFFGWQLQAKERTVQGELERVLSRLFNRPVRITGAGRTDRGVHAAGQVAAVDAPLRWQPAELRRAMNALLPREIWVADAMIAESDFHPRFDAVRRSYLYRVGTADESASPFHAPWCWALGKPLDLAAMREVTHAIIGDHSFRSFAKAGQEERGDRCEIASAEWIEWPGLGVELHISANRFLHHMVRYLVGTMVDVGLGKRPASDMTSLLDPGTRLETSPPAPPQGLFLTRVIYHGDSPVEAQPDASRGPRDIAPETAAP